MKIDSFKAVQPQVSADSIDRQLRDAAQMYEGQFLNEMVKSMRKTISLANKPSMAEEVYTDQIFQKYSDSWSEQGGIGLADIIYGQLRERYFPEKQNLQRPSGPIPLDKGTTIKIDETRKMALPLEAGPTDNKEMSYLFELDRTQAPGAKPVTSPWAGQIQHVLNHEGRQVVKLTHEDGMSSTISFIGTTTDLKRGDAVQAGQKLGTLSPDATGLTWQIDLAET